MGRRVEGKAKLAPVVPFVALAATSSPGHASEAPPEQFTTAPAFRVLIPGRVGDVVRRRLAGAQRRLNQPRCQSVLHEFSDAAGRPLVQRLDELGFTVQSYLGHLLFDSGRAVRPCASKKVLAVTNPGSPVVFLCPQFGEVAHFDPVEAELVLIHEMLHTLGLGESPPSSLEITNRVERRCRR